MSTLYVCPKCKNPAMSWDERSKAFLCLSVNTDKMRCTNWCPPVDAAFTNNEILSDRITQEWIDKRSSFITEAIDRDQLVARLNKHLRVVEYHQAPHCGYHHITFTSTEHQLRRLLKACVYGHAHVAVHLQEDESIVYRASISSGRMRHFLEYLEGDQIRQMYVELVYMAREKRKELFNKFCRSCGDDIEEKGDWTGQNYCYMCSPDPKD